ncbi:MAG: hypothetical protein U0V70_03600 [Terriglobia bacterium]
MVVGQGPEIGWYWHRDRSDGEVQLANARQQLIDSDSNGANLVRSFWPICLALDTTVEFDEILNFVPLTPKPVTDAIKTALTSRPDLAGSGKREAAETALQRRRGNDYLRFLWVWRLRFPGQ